MEREKEWIYLDRLLNTQTNTHTDAVASETSGEVSEISFSQNKFTYAHITLVIKEFNSPATKKQYIQHVSHNLIWALSVFRNANFDSTRSWERNYTIFNKSDFA